LLELDPDWYQELRTSLGYSTRNNDVPMTCIANSDGYNQILTLTFLPIGEQVQAVRVVHQDLVGAIHTFTEALKEKINLLSSETTPF
jgi:hypothetical protein